jgi:hypothetical protein
MMPRHTTLVLSSYRHVLAAAVALFALASTARAGFTDLGGYFGFHLGDLGDGPGIPADVPQSTGQITSPDGKSVKLFGNFGPIQGANWDINFVILWQGGYDSPLAVGDTYFADLDFSTNVTGGQVSWHYFSSMQNLDVGDDSRINTPFNPVPADGNVSGVHLVSDPFAADSPDGGLYTAYLQLDWENYAPTDTLTFNIPQNSVDVTVGPVPEPVSVGILCISAGSLLLRRYRWR